MDRGPRGLEGCPKARNITVMPLFNLRFHVGDYHICPNFRGAQFSQIAISKHFAETIFVDQEFGVYGIPIFHMLNFRGF